MGRFLGTDAPPAYDEVVRNLNSMAGRNATVKDYLAAGAKLPPDQLGVLVDAASKPVSLTADEKHSFALGMAKTISSPESQDQLRDNAFKAAQTTAEIDKMFLDLIRDLSGYDAKFKDLEDKPLAPQTQALKIDGNGHCSPCVPEFDQALVPIISDTTTPLADKQQFVRKYITETEQIGTKCGDMQAQFSRLEEKFAAFTGLFQNWAHDKITEDTARVATLNTEIYDLNKKIRDIKISLYVFLGLTAASLPVAGVAATCAGPWALPILIAGCIAAGVFLAISVGLAVGLENAEAELKNKEQERDRLIAEIQDIKNCEEELKELGDKDLKAFEACVGALSGAWTHALADAKEAQIWLDKGAKEDMPAAFKIYVEDAVHIYESLAQYLRAYAHGLVTVKTMLDGHP